MVPEPKAGENIGQYINRLLMTARTEPLHASFNGTPMWVHPGDDLDAVYKRWAETREAIQAEAARRKEAANNVLLRQSAAGLVTGVLDLCAEGDRAGAERVIYLAIGGTDV